MLMYDEEGRIECDSVGTAASLLVAIVLALAACGDGETEQSGDCTAGDSVECACSNGEMGTQVCQEGGTWGACDCEDESGQSDAGNGGGDTSDNDDGDEGDDRSWVREDDPDPVLVAKELQETPDVDGELLETTYESAMSIAVEDREDVSDNTAEVRALWDETHLYVVFEVEDDDLEHDGSAEFHHNDGVEIFIDVERDRAQGTLDGDDFHILVDVEGEALIKQGGPEGQHEVDDVPVEYAVSTKSDGYIVEVAMPWEQMQAEPERDDLYGFLVAVNDRDDGDHHGFAWDGASPFGHAENWHDLRLGPEEPDGEPGSGDDGDDEEDDSQNNGSSNDDSEDDESASVDDCNPLGEPPGSNVVDLGDEGLSEGDEIDPYLERWVEPGNQVRIPEGRYRWNGDGTTGKDLGNSSIIGEGEVVWDTGGGHTFSANFYATDDFELRNVTIEGKGGGRSDHDKIRVWAPDPDATIVMRNFNQPDGAEDGGRVGIYMPGDHSGSAYFIDCNIEGFPNNGIYGSSPGKGDNGEVHVIGGVYRNNNIANIRLASDNSSVIGAVSIHDQRAPAAPSGSVNQRGIWVREIGENIRIEDVDLLQDAGGSGAIKLQARDGGGSGTIENARIQNDISTSAITVNTGDWSGSDIDITGSGSDEISGGSFSDVCRGSGCDEIDLTPTARCD